MLEAKAQTIKGLGLGRGNKGKCNPNKQKMDENTESFKNFIRRYRNSPATKEAYTDWFRRYVWYSNLPDVKAKLGIDLQDGNTDLLLFTTEKEDSRKIQNHIKHYMDYLYDVLHLTPSSVRRYYIAVKHFYESNEITLNWHVMKDYLGIGSANNVSANLDMPYTYEEIHRMLDKADERKRIIIYLLASTGVRRGALPSLRYRDLKWIEQYQIYEIKVYSDSKDDSYITYCSLECASALNSYFDYRRRYGEQITPESYVIRKQFNRKNHSKLSKVSDARDPPEQHRVTNRDVEHYIYDLVYDSGIRDPDNKVKRLGDRHRNMMSHSFRKFFENKCLESGIDPFYVSVLMGHKAGIGVERHYYRPTSINGDNSLLELYVKKAMPYLTISDEQRLKLKNQELEMRLAADTNRIKEAEEQIRKSLEDKEKSNLRIMGDLSDRIEQLQRQLEELREEKKRKEN